MYYLLFLFALTISGQIYAMTLSRDQEVLPLEMMREIVHHAAVMDGFLKINGKDAYLKYSTTENQTDLLIDKDCKQPVSSRIGYEGLFSEKYSFSLSPQATLFVNESAIPFPKDEVDFCAGGDGIIATAQQKGNEIIIYQQTDERLSQLKVLNLPENGALSFLTYDNGIFGAATHAGVVHFFNHEGFLSSIDLGMNIVHMVVHANQKRAFVLASRKGRYSFLQVEVHQKKSNVLLSVDLHGEEKPTKIAVSPSGLYAVFGGDCGGLYLKQLRSESPSPLFCLMESSKTASPVDGLCSSGDILSVLQRNGKVTSLSNMVIKQFDPLWFCRRKPTSHQNK